MVAHEISKVKVPTMERLILEQENFSIKEIGRQFKNMEACLDLVVSVSQWSRWKRENGVRE